MIPLWAVTPGKEIHIYVSFLNGSGSECANKSASMFENVPSVNNKSHLNNATTNSYSCLIDFIDGLPKSNGFNSVLVLVIRLIKYAHFITLRHLFTTFTIVTLLVKEVVK